jgi:hypothetical protein
MRRSVDENSWFDSPATNSSPSRHFMSVTVKLRSGVCFQNLSSPLGASRKVTDVARAAFRSTRLALPSLVTANSAGVRAGPVLTAT